MVFNGATFWASLLLLIVVSVEPVKADLTEHFRAFLDKTYGSGSADRFARTDLSPMASFGGKTNESDSIVNQPVIMIHGTTIQASVFIPHRTFFQQNGYSESETYATTYSDAGRTPITKNKMCCEDVKLVREFIIAVHEYSNYAKVDVIGYSMGVAITRKAILGGSCVDTGEYLGKPLTKIVDTYIGVGGIAYGMQNCPLGVYESCNKNNGMNCHSDYLRDVNSKASRYEGQYSYSIYSTNDNIAGQFCCGHHCSEVKNSNMKVIKNMLDHGSILTTTKDIQLSLLRNHTLPVESVYVPQFLKTQYSMG